MKNFTTVRASQFKVILFVTLVSVCSAALLIPANTHAQTFGNATGTPTFSQNRSLWQKGDQVRALQQFLNALGFPVALIGPGSVGDETTLFGLKTYRALIRFQASINLPATGFFGPLTRAALNSLSVAGNNQSSAPSGLTLSLPTTLATTSDASSSTPLVPIGPPALTNNPFQYSPGFGGGGGIPTQTPTPDTTAPAVSVTAPTDNATVSGASVTLSATASDAVGVSGVQFKIDGANTGTEDTTSPYSITWDSTSVAYGSYTVAAVARDAAGNLATSSVTVIANNLTPSSAGSADLYWVGGSGNWSDGHHWAITSGGVGQYNPPTTSNIVHLDSSSSASSYTVTIDTAASTATTTVANPATGSPTFAGSATWTNAGGLTLVSGMGWTYTGAITFSATSLGKTITTAGVTLSNSITFNGVGGGWTNQDDMTTGSTNNITLTAGTWNTNAKTITAGIYTLGGSTARTLTATNSTLNVTGSSATTWNVSGLTNFTRTLTGSTINMLGSGATFAGGGITTYATVNFSGGGTAAISSVNTFDTLTVNSTTAKTDILNFNANQTISGTLTLAGISQANRLKVQSNTLGTARTITAAAALITNVDFSSITGAGAGTWSGTSIGNATGNTGITFTGAVTRYWVGNGGNWSDVSHWSTSSGGSGGATMPLVQDTANFDANSFSSASQTVVADEANYGAIDFTGVANSPTLQWAVAIPSIYGSMTTNTSMLMVSAGTSANLTWRHQSGTLTITSGGLFAPLVSITQNGLGGTLQLGDNLTWERGIFITAGTFNANNHNLTTSGFSSPGTLARAVNMGSGTWTITSSDAWNISGSGLTFNAQTSTIMIADGNPVTLGNVLFTGGGQTYNNFIWADDNQSTFPLLVTGANTFNNFTVDVSAVARTVKFPASVTTTATAFSLTGSATGQLSIVSSSPGTQATLSQSSGTVSGNYLTIQDSTATGGATWNATNSVDAGGNSGWNIAP